METPGRGRRAAPSGATRKGSRGARRRRTRGGAPGAEREEDARAAAAAVTTTPAPTPTATSRGPRDARAVAMPKKSRGTAQRPRRRRTATSRGTARRPRRSRRRRRRRAPSSRSIPNIASTRRAARRTPRPTRSRPGKLCPAARDGPKTTRGSASAFWSLACRGAAARGSTTPSRACSSSTYDEEIYRRTSMRCAARTRTPRSTLVFPPDLRRDAHLRPALGQSGRRHPDVPPRRRVVLSMLMFGAPPTGSTRTQRQRLPRCGSSSTRTGRPRLLRCDLRAHEEIHFEVQRRVEPSGTRTPSTLRQWSNTSTSSRIETPVVKGSQLPKGSRTSRKCWDSTTGFGRHVHAATKIKGLLEANCLDEVQLYTALDDGPGGESRRFGVGSRPAMMMATIDSRRTRTPPCC